ncbi:MAG: 1-deoxy-D-xylulose-5-phosphate synthase [Emticicia sp.]|uniref:1-deoxy-D-xylulose-5-phosphate synthase n=1 Tax=Emticicia sp. TaxID=1930953 RepID=UPI003BA6D908
MKATPNILSSINCPDDLKKLRIEQLPQLCDELRQFIIDTVATHGGHFGANLGTVELTVALHYVFDLPHDKLVWDVGHQAYGHKILTGRRDNFHSIRQLNGISGFPKRDESIYDDFGTGHSSTSISAALGMSVASKHKNENRQHIAVIGDGALTAGLAFEALNQVGDIDNNVLIVFNDNSISIDSNVGALKKHFQYLTESKEIIRMLALKHDTIFDVMSIPYDGPVDGHNVGELVKKFRELKKIQGPKVLHCATVKGKGYQLAEKDQTFWHAPGKFDPKTGELKKSLVVSQKPIKYQDVFGRTLVELARVNPQIVAVTPAMLSGSSLNIMKDIMEKRVFDVGIAEQHAVTFSAGLATQGLTVFCSIYSSFMQRAYDQVIHDVCLQKLPVIFCLDRAGLVGADGPTHHGIYDLAYMRCIPNIVVAAPMNEQELRNMMYTFQLPEFQQKGLAFSIRYPRGEGVMINWETPFDIIEIGKGRKIKSGYDLAILSVGQIGNVVVDACEALEKQGISAAHYDMRFVKPLDQEMLQEVFENFDKIITIEDGCLNGGFGSAVLETMIQMGYRHNIERLGISDEVVEHGETHQLYELCGIDKKAIIKSAEKLTKTSIFQY